MNFAAMTIEFPGNAKMGSISAMSIPRRIRNSTSPCRKMLVAETFIENPQTNLDTTLFAAPTIKRRKSRPMISPNKLPIASKNADEKIQRISSTKKSAVKAIP